MNNNLEYNIEHYTTLSHHSDKQSSESGKEMMHDPNFYQSFPLLRLAPPQLHQPTIANNSIEQETDTPIRITRPPNAYLLFNKEMRKILKTQDPSMKVADISKEVGLRWKTMPQEQKDQYVKQANKLKEEQRALHPNSMYIRRSRAELVKTDRRKKAKRNKNGSIPKHPLSAYMWYLTEVRPDTMRRFPGSNVGQISKVCANQWNAMTEDQRLPWKTKAQVDKERYAREMQIYALQNDQHLGRGTRQKYRSSAALKFSNEMMISAPTSPSSILHNTTDF